MLTGKANSTGMWPMSLVMMQLGNLLAVQFSQMVQGPWWSCSERWAVLSRFSGLSTGILTTGRPMSLSLLRRFFSYNIDHCSCLKLPFNSATSQWFANLDDIKDKALAALENVSFFPPVCTSLFVVQLFRPHGWSRLTAQNRLESFVRSRSEWCISRQRVWGVPIPSLHHIEKDTAILDSPTLEHILSVLEEKGVAHWWDGPVEDFLTPSLLQQAPASSWRKGTDTMDVWFDSGTSWSMLPEMDVGKDDTTGRKFHADLCLEGSDQHRGWFQSQLLTSIGAAPADSDLASPYGTLITHGMVLDEKGKKMSKSLGNIISPLTVVNGGKVGVAALASRRLSLTALHFRIRSWSQRMVQTS
jgi:isoleucyl-tRNA synthetase